MVITDSLGLPFAIHLVSASPHEVTLVEDTLEDRFVADIPERLIDDRAYDSDPLDEQLKIQGIEMIAPHRSNRKKSKTQGGRPLRRYKKRWKASLPGFSISVDLSFVMNIIQRTFWLLYC